MPSPLVLVPACSVQHEAHACFSVQARYVEALVQGAECQPLILPALGAALDWQALLAVAQGVMLTGSPSNVHPSHFGQAVHDPALPLDTARDATTLPLIRAALERGLPLLAICRGMQEVNVALGGSLHQAVHEQSGYHDHRAGHGLAQEQRYGPAHAVALTRDGILSRLLDGRQEMMVNSLHGQGIDRLAPGLRVEARAPDGLIEAYSLAGAPGFALAVQWHPEWRLAQHPLSMKLFAAFGAACRQYQLRKMGGSATEA